MKGIKKLLAAGLAGLLLTVPVGAEETTWEEIPNANIPAAVIQKEVAEAEGMQVALSLPVKSAILIDQNTGTVRYEMNADEKLPPASITKIMSLLLFMEALDSGKIALTDTVTCSEAAAGFGGSQIWLKPGEEMTVDDLLKAVAVQSRYRVPGGICSGQRGSLCAVDEPKGRRAGHGKYPLCLLRRAG